MPNLAIKNKLPGFTAERSLSTASFYSRWVGMSRITEQKITVQALAFPVREGAICRCRGDYQWCLRFWCSRIPLYLGGGIRCRYDDHWHFGGPCRYPR
jgi:hypothetical protein